MIQFHGDGTCIITVCLILDADSFGIPLRKGQEFKFEFYLPPDLPPSFSGEHGE